MKYIKSINKFLNSNIVNFYSYYLHNLSYFKIKEGTSNNYNGKMAYYLIKE